MKKGDRLALDRERREMRSAISSVTVRLRWATPRAWALLDRWDRVDDPYLIVAADGKAHMGVIYG